MTPTIDGLLAGSPRNSALAPLQRPGYVAEMARILLASLLITQTLLCPVWCSIAVTDSESAEHTAAPACCCDHSESHGGESANDPLQAPASDCECSGCVCTGVIFSNGPKFETPDSAVCVDVLPLSKQLCGTKAISAGTLQPPDLRPGDRWGRAALVEVQVWLI